LRRGFELKGGIQGKMVDLARIQLSVRVPKGFTWDRAGYQDIDPSSWIKRCACMADHI
jgi:hypothetical protein